MIYALMLSASLSQTQIVREPDRAVPQAKTIIDLTGETLTGAPPGPSISVYTVPSKAVFKSLMKVRGSMQDKLALSTDNL
jgi:hypothetical protein